MIRDEHDVSFSNGYWNGNGQSPLEGYAGIIPHISFLPGNTLSMCVSMHCAFCLFRICNYCWWVTSGHWGNYSGNWKCLHIWLPIKLHCLPIKHGFKMGELWQWEDNVTDYRSVIKKMLLQTQMDILYIQYIVHIRHQISTCSRNTPFTRGSSSIKLNPSINKSSDEWLDGGPQPNLGSNASPVQLESSNP